METTQIAQLAGLTLVLLVGLASIVSFSYRSYIAAHWEESRCDPGVIAIAGLFKPPEDPRTAAEFAADNWRFCQREYVQDAIRTAAKAPAALATATADTVADVGALAGVTGDIFADLWHFCHDVYKKFMGRMATTATLFRNFMIRLYSVVDRLQGSALSIVYSLIAVIVGIVNSIHVTVMAAVIVVGIMIALQIILFFLIWPISGLLATVAAMVDVVVISMATAVAGASGELFSGSACFTGDSLIRMADGSFKPIAEIRVGDMLYGAEGAGGSEGNQNHQNHQNRVTAVHQSVTREAVYLIGDVKVTGDHLIHTDDTGTLCYVKNLPGVVALNPGDPKHVWCLTTTGRTIPTAQATFADWEEINEEDMATKKAWYADVFKSLNEGFFEEEWLGTKMEEPTPAILNADAGFTKETPVLMADGQWKPISEIHIGDLLHGRWNRRIPVTGVVEIEGDMETDAIALGPSVMTPAVWIKDGGGGGDFKAAAFHPTATPVEKHPDRWYHLYTASGSFVIQGPDTATWHVRDANEVDGATMERMVTKHVIQKKNVAI